LKRWVKMWVNECLDGTIRLDFTPDERGVWYDLIILAGRMRQDGLIAAGPGMPYPRRWIAGTLNITEELLESTLQKCFETGRISEDGDGLRIINWKMYQSEYDRQKPYRDAKKKRLPSNEPTDPKKYTSGRYGHVVKKRLDDAEAKEDD